MNKVSRAGALFLGEMIAWAGLVATFLTLYVSRHGGTAAAVWPHVSMVVNIILVLICIRVFACRWIGNAALRAWLNAVLIALPLLILAIYYALVLTGLSSWGRVITWSLITSYAGQSGYLIEAFGASKWAVWGGLGGVVLVAVAVVARAEHGGDWVGALLGRTTPAIAMGGTVLVLIIVAIRVQDFVANSPVSLREPFALTLFPEQATKTMQSHSTTEARALEAREQAERERYVTTGGARRRNVILIVGDALRADHMSAYGYHRPTTPNMDRWLASPEADRVGSMYAVCAESSCGLMALAQSKYVHQMSAHPFSLQDVLRKFGYRIHLILGGDHTNFYGLREAYGEVDTYFDGASAKGYYMNDDSFVVKHVEGLPDWDGVPVYLQFHLMSAHALGSRKTRPEMYAPVDNYGLWSRSTDATRAKDPASVQAAINYYDNGVTQFDDVVSQLVGILGQKGYLQDALVVVSADHGDMLGEHGQFSHANGVHEGVLRIPLLMFRSGYVRPAPLDVAAYASQVDVAPTILRELDMPIPGTWSGQALHDLNRNRFVLFQQKADVGLIDARDPTYVYKYWRSARSSDEYSFDLLKNPAETKNLIDELPSQLVDSWRLAIVPGSNVTTL